MLLAIAVLTVGANSPVRKPLAVLRAYDDGLVTAVRGTIGTRTLLFDLDTGATHSFVDRAVVKERRLPVLGTTQIHGAGKGGVAALRLGRFVIALESARFPVANGLSIPFQGVGSAIDEQGLLGFDFYSRYVVYLNYDDRSVALYARESYVYRGSGIAVPLVLQPPRAFVYVTVSAPGVKAERHLLRLDTGSSDAVDDDIVLRSSEPKKAIEGGVGIGSRFKTYLGTVSELRVGPFRLHDLPSATGGVQLIGDAVWRRFNVVFDFSRSRMYLTPRSHD